MQLTLDQQGQTIYSPPSSQLLKWVGSKHRFADEITKNFPSFNHYFEPFLGSGAVLATVAPSRGIGSDVFKPLIEIWQTLKVNPELLIEWYSERRNRILDDKNKIEVYSKVLTDYNIHPNGADFLFLTRACYGGIIRFRKKDGFMSTPCGAHLPIPVDAFIKRVNEWHKRVKHTEFFNIDYSDAFDMAKSGDLVYCDPPYSFSQAILYGAQNFSLEDLLQKIDHAKSRGVKVALSIDGNKKSGNLLCNLPIPTGLFEQEIMVHVGRSMLRRFQMEGQTLEEELVHDRLLLTY